MRPIKHSLGFLLLSLIVFSFLAGCKGLKNDKVEPTTEIIIQPTSTPKPDRVVLVSSSAANAESLNEATTFITELAVNSGLEFEKREQVFPNEISADVRIIIFLSHPENLGSLANAAPQTQFVVISDRDWTPTNNVTIIRLRPENQAFLAGYITGILPDDYRAGGLLNSENVQANTAFINGVYYYCGLCQALIFPLNKYPVSKALNADSTSANWIAAFEEMNLNTILSLYLTPEAYSAELFIYLSNYDIQLVGISTPPQEALAKWTVTVLPDGLSPIREIWETLLQGQGGQILNASLKLEDIQSSYFTQGKQIQVRELIDLFQAGEVFPLDVTIE